MEVALEASGGGECRKREWEASTDNGRERVLLRNASPGGTPHPAGASGGLGNAEVRGPPPRTGHGLLLPSLSEQRARGGKQLGEKRGVARGHPLSSVFGRTGRRPLGLKSTTQLPLTFGERAGSSARTRW